MSSFSRKKCILFYVTTVIEKGWHGRAPLNKSSSARKDRNSLITGPILIQLHQRK